MECGVFSGILGLYLVNTHGDSAPVGQQKCSRDWQISPDSKIALSGEPVVKMVSPNSLE